MPAGRPPPRRRRPTGRGGAIEAAGPAHELPAPEWLARGYRDTGDLRPPGPAGFRFLISAVLATSRWFFDGIGGFDERFDDYGGEDWEFGFRAWHAGALLAHVPQAVAWHDGPEWGRRQVPPEVARRQKNLEARRLAGLLGAAGHRPRGLLGRRAEQLIELPSRLDLDAAFVTVDSLLGALPRAAVRATTELAGALDPDPRVLAGVGDAEWGAWPTLRLEVSAGFTVSDPAALAARCERLLGEDGGGLCLGDGTGPLLKIETARQRARRGRWGPAGAWSQASEVVSWLDRLPEPCDVEAYLGGWTR